MTDLRYSSPTDPSERKRIERLARQGALVRIAPGLYVDAADPEGVVRRTWLRLVRRFSNDKGHISHRSALQLNPFARDLFVAVPGMRQNRIHELPGMRIYVLSGMPRPDTRLFRWKRDSAPVSTPETALLEMLEPRRGRFAAARSGPEEVELAVYRAHRRLNPALLRDVASKNDLDPEPILRVLTAVRTRDLSRLVSAEVRSLLDEADGDPIRAGIFSALVDHLAAAPREGPRKRPWSSDDDEQWDRYAFIAAYFSNYVEGTVFEPEDAEAIVYRGEDRGPAPDRRTLVATYRTYKRLRSIDPPAVGRDGADRFVEWVREVHESVAGGNLEMDPGVFKTKKNRPSGSEIWFVEPRRVRATLSAGWAAAARLTSPFDRACFLGFVVAEVHPFKDGNGRVSRVVADAYLVRAGYSGLVVTTRSRDLYLRAYRAATRQERGWPQRWEEGLRAAYEKYPDLPVRSREATIEFLKRENLEGR